MTARQNRLRIAVNILTAFGIIATVIFCIWGYREGVFTSTTAMEGLLSRAGVWAPMVFIGLQIVQVVIPIIPGSLGCAVGVLVFGPWYGFLYNYIGICIGSVLNFLLARRYGKPFVQSIIRTKTYDKYVGWLDQGDRFNKLFAIAIFLPAAPDDYLCMLAGLTKMSLRRFVVIILTCKPASIAAYSLGLAALMTWLAGFLP